MTPKLSDLQLVLLSAAVARDDGSLLPLPASIATQPARVSKTLPALLKRGLVKEVGGVDAAQAWREEQDGRLGLLITHAGRAAIGVVESGAGGTGEVAPEQPVTTAASAAARPTKAAQVLALLRRAEGATLAELVDATGWLPHTTRAALTGLRKKRHSLVRAKRGDTTCYHLAEAV